MPTAKLAALVGRYIDLAQVCPDSERKGTLLVDVKAFEKASRAGRYYESFNVNSKNYREQSEGTRRWMDDCRRLFDRCVAQATTTDAAGVREALETLFGLLRHVDEGHDDVVFFAAEGGAWQVGVVWQKVLPAWFACLAKTAEPKEYARMVVKTVKEFDGRNRRKHMVAARTVGSPAQALALARLSRPQRATTTKSRP